MKLTGELPKYCGNGDISTSQFSAMNARNRPAACGVEMYHGNVEKRNVSRRRRYLSERNRHHQQKLSR